MRAEVPPVFGLIERDLNANQFVGKIVGFPHVEFCGPTLASVEKRLQEHLAEMIAGDTLVLEAEFAAIVLLNARKA